MPTSERVQATKGRGLATSAPSLALIHELLIRQILRSTLPASNAQISAKLTHWGDVLTCPACYRCHKRPAGGRGRGEAEA
jgi:hypothetical protein